jgi:hypothetical protein
VLPACEQTNLFVLSHYSIFLLLLTASDIFRNHGISAIKEA